MIKALTNLLFLTGDGCISSNYFALSLSKLPLNIPNLQYPHYDFLCNWSGSSDLLFSPHLALSSRFYVCVVNANTLMLPQMLYFFFFSFSSCFTFGRKFALASLKWKHAWSI